MPNTLVRVDPIGGFWTGARTVFFECEAMITLPWNIYRGYEQAQCRADSGWLVTQIGELTGRQFSLHMCQKHAQPYLDALGITERR